MAANIMLSESAGEVRLNTVTLDGAYYWYLYPVLKQIEKETGRLIELYEYVEFFGEDLRKLKSMVANFVKEVEGKEDYWDVLVGTQGGKELFEKVSRSTLLNELKNLITLCDKAEELKLKVISVGN